MSAYQYLEIVIQYVFRASFNDTYYLETIRLELDDIVKEDIVWIDPYNNRSKLNQTVIGIKDYSDKEFTILEKTNGDIKEIKCPIRSVHICSEDYNDSMFLAAHICVK